MNNITYVCYCDLAVVVHAKAFTANCENSLKKVVGIRCGEISQSNCFFLSPLICATNLINILF